MRGKTGDSGTGVSPVFSVLSPPNPHKGPENMPVYLIIDIAIIDQDAYGEFVERVPAVVEQYGGRYLVRGGEVSTMVGDWQPERIVLIQFESIEQVQEFFASPEYLAIVPLREQSAATRAIIIEGYGP